MPIWAMTVFLTIILEEEDLLNGYEATPVTGAIVQPSLPRFSLQANQEIHDRIARLCSCEKMKFWGLASIYPHFFAGARSGNTVMNLLICLQRKSGQRRWTIAPVTGVASYPFQQIFLLLIVENTVIAQMGMYIDYFHTI